MKPLEYLLSADRGVPRSDDWHAAMFGGQPGEWSGEQLAEAEGCWLSPDKDELKHLQLSFATWNSSGCRPNPAVQSLEVYHAPSQSLWKLLERRTHPELLSLSQAAWGGLRAFEAAYLAARTLPVPTPKPSSVLEREAFHAVMGNIVQVPHERQTVFSEIGPTDLALSLVDAEVGLLEAFGSDLSPLARRLFFDTWEQGMTADQPIITRARFEVGEKVKKLHANGAIAALPPRAYELDDAVLDDLRGPMLQLWVTLDEPSRAKVCREFSSEWLASAQLLFPELAPVFQSKEPVVTKMPFLRHLDDVKSMISVVQHLCVAEQLEPNLTQALAIEALCNYFELSPPEVTP